MPLAHIEKPTDPYPSALEHIAHNVIEQRMHVYIAKVHCINHNPEAIKWHWHIWASYCHTASYTALAISWIFSLISNALPFNLNSHFTFHTMYNIRIEFPLRQMYWYQICEQTTLCCGTAYALNRKWKHFFSCSCLNNSYQASVVGLYVKWKK